MAKVYAEITENCVNVYTKAKPGWGMASFALPLGVGEVAGVKLPAVLVANTRLAAIRVVGMPPVKWQDIFKPADRWEFVKQGYPISEKMNETTHIFDGTVFENAEGVRRFFMVALPHDIAAEMGKNCASLLGGATSLKCLDTIEHYIFRHFLRYDNDNFWVVFPQDEGFRILYLTDGLPYAAWSISDHLDFRLAEVGRIFDGLKAESEDGKTALAKAIVLNTDLDLEWLYQFFAERDVEVEQGNFVVTDFFNK